MAHLLMLACMVLGLMCPASAQAPATTQPIAGVIAVGDSMAAGAGSTAEHLQWIAILGRELKVPYKNAGIGGSTSTQAAAMQSKDTEHRKWLAIYWTGHNNPDKPSLVIADIKRMIARQTEPRFLVLLPVQNAANPVGLPGYRKAMLLAADLMAAFPRNCIDMRGVLDAASNRSPEDNLARDGGFTPKSLRADNIHLNDAGNAVVAKALAAEIRKRGWTP